MRLHEDIIIAIVIEAVDAMRGFPDGHPCCMDRHEMC
jgi:hypothetical protein